jgi:Co/Zn/Cd efflux system component
LTGISVALSDPTLRRVVVLVAALNLGYFRIEFAVATVIGSVSLFR